MAVSFDQVEAILLESSKTLIKYLRPDGILRDLKAARAIKPDEVDKIKRESTNPEKMEKLLDILRTSPVESYQAFMRCLKEERTDLYTYVKGIQDKHCGIPQPAPVPPPGSASACLGIPQPAPVPPSGNASDKLTDADIRTITGKLSLTSDQLTKLYLELDLKENEIENAKRSAGTDDVELQGNKVLQAWRAKKGKDATKGAMLKAMKERPELTEAMETLKGKWDISSI